MTNTVQTAAAPASNTGLSLEKFLGQCQKFGEAFAKGENSRPAMALATVNAAQKLEGVTAADVYSAFQRGNGKCATFAKTSNESSYKVQVAKVNTFVKCGSLPGIDAVDVFNRASDIIKEMLAGEDSGIKGSAYDNMVNVGRAQLKQPDSELSDDEIRSLLIPEESEKSFFDKMVEVHKRLSKLHDEAPSTGSKMAVEDALADVEASINEAGGDAKALLAKKAKKAKGKGGAPVNTTITGVGNAAPIPAGDDYPSDDELLEDDTDEGDIGEHYDALADEEDELASATAFLIGRSRPTHLA